MIARRRRSRSGQAIVLAYHAIADLSADPLLGKYGVPPVQFVKHLDMLTRLGWSFIDAETLLRGLEGACALPRRSVLLTFDDGYADILEVVCPLLVQRRFPAVVFVVSDRIGGSNTWDSDKGAASLRLLNAEELRAVAAQGVEVGSHTATHRALPDLPPDQLRHELVASAQAIESHGLPRPRVFSYPHGMSSPRAAGAVEESGYAAAFTILPGVVSEGDDRFALARVEIFANDSSRRVRIKMLAATWPSPIRDLVLRLLRVLA